MSFVKRHYPLFIVAALVSFIYGSHHFYIGAELKNDGNVYYPVTVASSRDEILYAARARAVMAGQWKAGDIAIAGNEESPALLPLLNPIIMGGLGKVLGSLERAFMVSDFLFPPLIFIGLYALAFELTGKKKFALLFAVLFMFVPKFFTTLPPFTPGLLKKSLSSFLPDPSNGLYFARYEYPKVTFVFFVSAWYFLVRALRRGGKRNVFFAGVGAGLLFYTYLFDWVYFFGGMGVMLALFAWGKHREYARRLLAVMGIGMLIGSLYWVNFFALRALPHFDDIAARIGVELGRNLRWETVWKSYARIALFVPLMWIMVKRKRTLSALVVIAFLLTYFFVVNIQLVIGFNPHPDHWHRVQYLTIALAAGMLIERAVRAQWRSKARVAGVALGIYVMGMASFQQVLFSKISAWRYAVDAAYAKSYEWIEEHVPQTAVIGSVSSLTNVELPIYVHRNVFLPNGFHTTISNREIWIRFMLLSKVFNVSSADFAGQMDDSSVLRPLFYDTYRDRSFDSYFRTDAVNALPVYVYNRLSTFYETLKLPDALPYRLDYVYFGPRESALGEDPRNRVPSLQEVYRQDGVVIYSYRS